MGNCKETMVSCSPVADLADTMMLVRRRRKPVAAAAGEGLLVVFCLKISDVVRGRSDCHWWSWGLLSRWKERRRRVLFHALCYHVIHHSLMGLCCNVQQDGRGDGGQCAYHGGLEWTPRARWGGWEVPMG